MARMLRSKALSQLLTMESFLEMEMLLDPYITGQRLRVCFGRKSPRGCRYDDRDTRDGKKGTVGRVSKRRQERKRQLRRTRPVTWDRVSTSQPVQRNNCAPDFKGARVGLECSIREWSTDFDYPCLGLLVGFGRLSILTHQRSLWLIRTPQTGFPPWARPSIVPESVPDTATSCPPW